MSIRFACGSCGKKFKVGEEHAGKKTKCPGCGKPVVIPQTSEGEPPSTDASPAKTPPVKKPAAPVGKQTATPPKPQAAEKPKEQPAGAAAGNKVQPDKKKKKNKVLLAVLLLVVALLAVAGYYWYFEGYIPFIIPKVGG